MPRKLKQFLSLHIYCVYLFLPFLLSSIAFSLSGFLECWKRRRSRFPAGLKIPAPWAAGKTVETVHPVRDNYKFKETVHIPGAAAACTLDLIADARRQYDYDKVEELL